MQDQFCRAVADLRGDPVTVRGDGELARCLQHETGHLHGELYIDRPADPRGDVVASAGDRGQ